MESTLSNPRAAPAFEGVSSWPVRFCWCRFPRGPGGGPRFLLVLGLRATPGGELPAVAVRKAADQPTCFLTSGSASPDSDLGSSRSPRFLLPVGEKVHPADHPLGLDERAATVVPLAEACPRRSSSPPASSTAAAARTRTTTCRSRRWCRWAGSAAGLGLDMEKEQGGGSLVQLRRQRDY